jgi:membrane-associated phospholipid phosphatase
MLELLENDLGLSIVKFLQQGWWGDILWYLLYPFQFLGSEMGFLIILPIVYWSVNKPAGKRLFILALAGTIITGFLKSWWHRPRPFHVAPDQIEHIATTPEPGVPSGHSIFGTEMGLWIINYFRNRRISIYMILFILLMGISRMVHGMHYPQDVVLGWFFGALFFWIYYKMEPLIVHWFKQEPFRKGIIFSLVLWTIVFTLAVVIWDKYEIRKSILSPLGALVGGLLGIFFEERFITVSIPVRLKNRLLRAVTGIILLLMVYFLLDLGYYALFEGNHSVFSMVFYTIRYMLVGFMVTYMAPVIFKYLKL